VYPKRFISSAQARAMRSGLQPVPVGSAYDPEDKAGLADMTARHEPWDP
jgi:hypothetical protein